MNFEVEKVGEIAIIVAPKIDLHDYLPLEEYGEAMCNTVDENMGGHILMDLQRVSFVGTPILAAFVRAHLTTTRRQLKFAICNGTEFILEVLHKVRLDRILMIFPTREEALAAMNAPGDFYGRK